MARKIILAVIRSMKIAFHGTTGLACGALPQFTHLNQLIKGMAVILIALLFQITSQVQGQTSQGSYEVKLAWNASVSKDVTGYRIHCGTSSGTYNTRIVLGNVTSTTVSGLADGETYYFVVSAFNASGLESGLSNEVAFEPGLHTSKMSTAASSGNAVLIVRGLTGCQYDIEASVDLKTWTLIDTVTLPKGGSLEFSDPDAASYPQRFYRTCQSLIPSS